MNHRPINREPKNTVVTVLPLPLGHVLLPDAHPRAATDRTCPIICHAVQHPDGVVLVDTGPDVGHPVIDELYQPDVRNIIDALNDAGMDERDVVAVVNSHLHFDHCGQNHRLPNAEVWVTEAEVAAAAEEFYTVAEWANIAPQRRRLSRDGDMLAEGIRILHTPGHTPGHQSVSVDTADGLVVLAGQACYSCVEFETGLPAMTDMHDETWLDAGVESLRRLTALSPDVVHFSHDEAIYQPRP